MQNPLERNESKIHTIHNGRFYFSIDGGKKPTWYNVKVLQGKHKTLVILSEPREFIPVRMFDGAAAIATQITNLFGLHPATTMYLEFIPPSVPTRYEDLKDGPLAEFVRYANAPGDEKYERITFQWRKSDAKEPILERYSIHDTPFWLIISPGEAAKLLMELEKE